MKNDILSKENIKELREKQGWSREDLAKMLGVSSKTIARWESDSEEEKPSGSSAILLTHIISNILGKNVTSEESMLIKTLSDSIDIQRMRETGDVIFDRVLSATHGEKIELCKALRIPENSSNFRIVKEYRSVAGFSFVNIFRTTELPYKQILVDVANKIKPKGAGKFYLEDEHSEKEIEDNIMEFFAKQIADELNSLSEEDRKKKVAELIKKMKESKMDIKSINQFESALAAGGAIGVGTIITLATAPLTAAIFYSGLFAGMWAGVFGMGSTYLALTGTGVGLAAALPIFVFYLSAPSYRKTIPATLQLIGIRKRIESQFKIS